MKKLVFILFTGAFFMTSCAHQAIIHESPTVDVVSPDPDNIYNNGDTVHIEMTLADEDALHEAYIYVRSDTDSAFAYAPYVHDMKTFDVDTFWVVTGMTTGVSAFVTAVVHNHHDKMTTINVPITLIP